MHIRGTKTKPVKQDIIERKASLARQARPARGEATPRSGQPRHPGRAGWGSRRKNHHTNHTTMTHIVNQCSVKPQDD